MAVESRGDLASRHGSIDRIATAHSGFDRSDNPICTRTPFYPLGREVPEIPVNVNITPELCPDTCARDVITMEIYDDRFEIWGSPIEEKVVRR